MKSSFFTAALLSLLSVADASYVATRNGACTKNIPDGFTPGETTVVHITSQSGVADRSYRLHLPTDYAGDKCLPVILSFHGRGKDAESQEQLSQFSNSSYGFEGIAVYPEGIPFKKDGSVQQWQGDPDAPKSINDVKFTLEILDDIEDKFCVDTSRIYAAGKSNGGGFTGLLACDADATKRIAAFAPVSGAFYLDDNGNLPACAQSHRQIPLMEFHGWKDTTIPYLGGENTRGNAEVVNIITYVDDWANRDGFKVDANKTSYLCSGNKKVTRYSWNDIVVHYNYTNLAHDWPSSFANGDTGDNSKLLTCVEAEATSIILAWFKKWTL